MPKEARMPEFDNPLHQLVRVRNNGVEFNVGRAVAIAERFEVLDESAYDETGVPREAERVVESGADAGQTRPVKPKTSVADKAAEKKAALSAESDNQPSEKE